jgi:GTP-binding protein
MIRITSAEFVISAVARKQFPNTPMPEVAFVGRSNVGKSSLINGLVGRKKLAKTSSTPGKTRQINFFLINGNCHFADLPGYGYAKVSKVERETWRKLIESYLVDRPQLKMVVALCDIRHEPTALDRSLWQWLESIERPFLIVLTKYDKISPALAQSREDEALRLTEGYQFVRGILSYSSQTRHNRETLLAAISEALSN